MALALSWHRSGVLSIPAASVDPIHEFARREYEFQYRGMTAAALASRCRVLRFILYRGAHARRAHHACASSASVSSVPVAYQSKSAEYRCVFCFAQ